MALIELEGNWGSGFGGWLRVVGLKKLERNSGIPGFGGWLKVWVALIKLIRKELGGPSVWGLA